MTFTADLREAPAHAAPAARHAVDRDALCDFIELEAELLDRQQFAAWCDLYADDGAYWVPAQKDQDSYLSHVSLFYDEKPIMKTRVARLLHPMIHCQDPKSQCVRVISNLRLDSVSDDGTLIQVASKFIMLEDRVGADRRVFGGRYLHTLRRDGSSFRIVVKRVDLTNCDHSFPALTQPI
jgi:3-phenylpropionate/cinnamic acid dioxygenase small subunit